MYVLRTKRRYAVPNVMQTDSGIKRIWTVKNGGLGFWVTPGASIPLAT